MDICKSVKNIIHINEVTRINKAFHFALVSRKDLNLSQCKMEANLPTEQSKIIAND